MKEFCCVFLLFLTTAPTLFSQKYLPKSALTADLDTLYLHLRELHPNMYGMISEEDFEKNFEETKSSLPDSLTAAAFFAYAAPLVNSLVDGHTTMAFPEDVIVAEDPRVLPTVIGINGIDQGIWTRDGSDGAFLSPIVSINGLSSRQISGRLLSFLPGETMNSKIALFNSSIAYPYLLFSLIDRPEFFDIEYISGDTLRSIYLEASSLVKPEVKEEEDGGKEDEDSYKKDFSFSKIDSETVLLKMASFTSKADYYQYFFDSLFVSIRNDDIKNFIIDVRNNRGGETPVVRELLRYISPVDFKVCSNYVFRMTDLAHSYEIPKKAFEQMGMTLEEAIAKADIPPGVTIKDFTINMDDEEKPHDESVRFSGNIYVLTNSLSFSAAGLFPYVVQKYKIGKIIGEETGGQQSTYGNRLTLTLPNSGLKYDVATVEIGQKGTTRKDWRPIIPDYEIQSKYALDKALKLIASQTAQ